MKLTIVEKSNLKLLYHAGFRYVVRDELGLYAYKERPILHIAKDKSFKFWLPETTNVEAVFLDFDSMSVVGYHETVPYKISEIGNLTPCRQSKSREAI